MEATPRKKPGSKPRLGETVRVNVNIPKALLVEIDSDADDAQVSRSEIFRRRLVLTTGG